MITPIATIIFAAAMALSLSVEAESVFHEPPKVTDEPSEVAPGAASEEIATDGMAIGP